MLVLPRSILDAIVAQARAEAPNECCGILGGRDGEAITRYKLANAAASPLRYEIEPSEQLRVFEAIDSAGEEITAIYHSHTRSAPEPSQTDINLAFYPEVVYLIVGVADERDDVRAWRIVGGKVSPAELEVRAD